MLIRLGIGLGIVAVALISFLGWLKTHDAAIRARAQAEIRHALAVNRAEKEQAAAEAENTVTPTPGDAKELAALCQTDLDCRERKP